MGNDTSTIGELVASLDASIKTGPFGTKLKSSEYGKTGVPVISVGEIGHGRINLHEKTPRVSAAVTSRMPEYLLQEGDIVFARKGGVERSAYVRANESGYFLGSDGIRVRIGGRHDPRFIAYQFLTKQHQNWMLQNAGGTTMPSLNEGIIKRIPILVPPLAKQKRIAGILGALDDKIELNRRMNETLEQMARALFKSWFVDFDPVHAKAAGRQPFGMDKATADLFPDSFEESELGKIPKGWTVTSVGEAVECLGGATPSTSEVEYWEGGIHNWATPKDLSSLQSPFLLNTERKITNAGASKISSGLLPVGTLLLSSRAPIGYLAIATIPVAINQGFIAMKCGDKATNFFMLNWCRANMAEIDSRATGTTFQEISKLNFRPIRFCLPSKDVMASFTASVQPFYAKIVANLRQTRGLESARDTLLPKLLSNNTLKLS